MDRSNFKLYGTTEEKIALIDHEVKKNTKCYEDCLRKFKENDAKWEAIENRIIEIETSGYDWDKKNTVKFEELPDKHWALQFAQDLLEGTWDIIKFIVKVFLWIINFFLYLANITYTSLLKHKGENL